MAQNNNKDEGIEKTLWKAADKLRKNIDAAEYKHVVLGLIFLRYISDAFEELHEKLLTGQGEYAGADPEDRDEYRAENVFFVPPSARWGYLQSRAKTVEIGKDVDAAMDAIERDNPSLRGVLPKVYARGNLDPTNLGGLIDLISNIAMNQAQARSADVLGHVFEYFLGEFALAEGKKGGTVYTPKSVVKLLVEMLEPYKGRVFDPCCGSGGMFVQSERFVAEHQGRVNDISIYGQESNQTTWRLAKMNLAIRGIDSSQVLWNNEGSFLNDAHKDLKADFILANPPFNDSDWSGDLLRGDGRWQYGEPPGGNANYAWIQHFLYHLSPAGRAGFVLAKGALTSKTSGEGDIRKALVEARLVDCIVNLPAKLFLNTQIPASLWFLRRAGDLTNLEDLSNLSNLLFIDARNLGHLINRRTLEFSDEDIAKIANTYHAWRNRNRIDKSRRFVNSYEDIPGFCKSEGIQRVRELDYVLTPGRYVGLPDEEDDFDFAERFMALQKELAEQMAEESRLNALIQANLRSEVMSEWRKLTLGELIEKGQADLQTGPFGTMLNSSEYVPSGIPVIAVQDIGNNRLIHDKFVFVNEATANRLDRYKVKNGDIIFGRKGAVDRRAIVKKSEEGWLQGSDCIRLRFNDDTDSRFVSYQFGSGFHKEWMLQNAGGATMPSLNQQILKLLPITLPSLSEQRAITAVLASLDDKLDLLQRQNKTLEGLAQTLFRHWFVDGAEDDWEVGTLDNVLTAKGGTTPSTNNPEFWDGEIHWTTPRDLSNNNSPFLLDTERKITESGLAKISSGLLPKGTLLLSSRAPIGYMAFAEVPIAINQGYIAILDNKGFSKHLIYLWLKENMEYVKSYANGSTFLEISKSAFRTLEFIIPPAQLRVDFEQIIAPLFEKIRTNVHQVRTLEKLRDTLLPKLMSGEVRVRQN